MATKPSQAEIERTTALKDASSTDLLNSIALRAGSDYNNVVPQADGTLESLRAIGQAVTEYEPVYQQFMGLLGRIAFTIVKNTMFKNPLAIFKQGYLEYGETIQEIFVQMAEPHQYDELEDLPDWHMLQLEHPDIDQFFHYVNYEIYYKRSFKKREVKQAFLSESGVADLIDRIVQTMYQSASWDEYNITMYMLGRNVLEGRIHSEESDDTNLSEYMGYLRGLSNTMATMTSKYNEFGLPRSTPIEEQVVLVTTWFDGKLDAESLAYAFHDDKADFKQRKILINSFGDLDFQRINKLLSVKKGQYAGRFTQEEIEFLDSFKCFVVDFRYFMIFDCDAEMTNHYNGEKRAWTYWLHQVKVVSSSPVEQAVAIGKNKPVTTGITVSSATITTTNHVWTPAITATVTSDSDFGVDKSVVWSWQSVNPSANLEVKAMNTEQSVIQVRVEGAENGDVITLKATTADGKQSADVTINVEKE